MEGTTETVGARRLVARGGARVTDRVVALELRIPTLLRSVEGRAMCGGRLLELRFELRKTNTHTIRPPSRPNARYSHLFCVLSLQLFSALACGLSRGES